jgi:hypothetical protein
MAVVFEARNDLSGQWVALAQVGQLVAAQDA